MAVAIYALTLVAELSMQTPLSLQFRSIPLWSLPDLLLPIVVPAFTAGSFAREFEQRTWDDVRLTLLGSWEIIRGKFAACLLPSVVCIIVMFPAFAMLLLVQGVTWALDFGPWIIIVIVKFLISTFFYVALVMLCSYCCNTGRTALVASYVLLASYALANYIVWVVIAPLLYDMYIGVDPDSELYRAVHWNTGYETRGSFNLSPFEVAHTFQAVVFGVLSLAVLRWRLGKRS
jgi:ABC-type transport system involved in multi-copper enzyme maturation permease subunit